MPRFTILHIFDIVARDEYEATDELMLARKHNFDKDYLVKVIVRKHGDKKNKTVIDMRPPASWKTIFLKQVTGK